MQTLNLHIKHRLGINLNSKRSLNMVRKPLLIALLNGSPLLLESRIVDKLEKALKLVEVL